MSSGVLFALGGLGLVLIGFWALVLRAHLLRKVLALNVMGSGTFLVLVSSGAIGSPDGDPVAQAMVLTGIVVALSATALALSLLVRLARATGHPCLPEDRARLAAEYGEETHRD
jgi:multicomponent Na+:H+ antiporter subunit C